MIAYLSGTELIERIRYTYLRFDAEFDDLDEAELHLRLEDVDRTPYEMLAYLLGSLQLIQQWERSEQQDGTAITPAPGLRWHQLGELYASFYERYKKYTLTQLRQQLRQSVQQWCQWIEELSEQELFGDVQRRWATTPAGWQLWKWLHMNAVAPFHTFRTRIRKWKKQRLLDV
ncbi:ClbS/DfsB family four-helix bundle protein [Paenibacillus campi]|uniref:ClbS/DfsB family four-helix bundle protein n=1 Tax=Paenibacillus campi TaxID=3106031 RepID=UPI002AFF7D58|nr:ClbS/DfsB family four-helix bundle protein [Paenibacillus sp. SGZ-1009]